MNPWLILILAGLLETGWAVGLKYTDGFTRLGASVWTAFAIAASTLLLSIAAREIPIGTAYPAWVGIGTVGAVVLGTLLFGEPFSLQRTFFLVLLVVAIVGLKATSTAVPPRAAPADAAKAPVSEPGDRRC